MRKSAFLGVVFLSILFYLLPIRAEAEGNLPEVVVSPLEAKVVTTLDASVMSIAENEALDQMLSPAPGRGAASYVSDLPEISLVAVSLDEAAKQSMVDVLNQEISAVNSSHTELAAGDVTIHLRPYLYVSVEELLIPDDLFFDAPNMTVDVSMKYDVVASAKRNAEEIVLASGADTNSVVIAEDEPIVLAPDTEIEITLPVPEAFQMWVYDLKLRHEIAGEVFYDVPECNSDHTMTFSDSKELGAFTYVVDVRAADVKFVDLDVVETYEAIDINRAIFPTAQKEGFIFQGWEIEGIDGIHNGILTEQMMDKLYDLAFSGIWPINAHAVFEPIPFEEPLDKPDNKLKEDAGEIESTDISDTGIELIEVAVPKESQQYSAPADTSDPARVWVYVMVMVGCQAPLKKYKLRKNG